MQTVIGLVAAGVGISLVPESVRALVRHGVTYRPLDGDAPAVKAGDGLAGDRRVAGAHAFLEKARAAAPAEGERGRRGPARN